MCWHAQHPQKVGFTYYISISLTLFRNFSSTLQRRSLLALSVDFHTTQKVQEDGLACPELSKGELFRLNFDFLTVFRSFSSYLHRANISAPSTDVQIIQGGLGDVLECPAPDKSE
jgi:hypothetical protein